MSAVPGDIDAAQGPPTTVPLRHFLVGIGFLLAGLLVGGGLVVDAIPGLGGLAQAHLLLVGWVCVTIMGAMTQFVPVWSGVRLHSRRLATVQLLGVVAGLAGFAVALALGRLPWLAPFGALMLAGFWTFVYNVGRTLAGVEDPDVTERHFAVALGFFVLLTALGVTLAADLGYPFLADWGIAHAGVRGAHATLAVLGAVLTTVYGALYQLGTMFTQTELRGADHRLRAVEEVGHPVGVVGLAAGRLLGAPALARAGAALVVVAALAFAVVLGRKLVEMRVERTPMHTRYGVVAVALPAWALTAAPAWLRDPLAADALFGGPGSVPLLFGGVLGFVVLGTLYHIVPFVVWVDEYSDRLGFEPVPMIDDLYDDRVAAADGALLVVGTALIVVADLAPGALASTVPGGDAAVTVAGGALATLGVVAFAANVVGVIHRHGPDSLPRVLFGRLVGGDRVDAGDESASGD